MSLAVLRSRALAGMEAPTVSVEVHLANGLPSFSKAELPDLLFEQVGLNKRETKDMVEAFFDDISDELERGESVKLTGFGNFQLRDKASRLGRNPKTGEDAAIPARRVVTFRASQKLKTVADGSSISSASRHVDDNSRE